MTSTDTPSMPCAALLTKNELNNLIYMFLRYGLRFNGRDRPDVNNEDVIAIMKQVPRGASKTKLLDATITFVETKYGSLAPDLARKEIEQQLELMYEHFLGLPASLRNDLGQDSAYFAQKELN